MEHIKSSTRIDYDSVVVHIYKLKVKDPLCPFGHLPLYGESHSDGVPFQRRGVKVMLII
jgi:hypothetical protein